jgi:energy-coupling factor transporter ATP-binding protein EcfA2
MHTNERLDQRVSTGMIVIDFDELDDRAILLVRPGDDMMLGYPFTVPQLHYQAIPPSVATAISRVYIIGAQQSGKSTLVRALRRAGHKAYDVGQNAPLTESCFVAISALPHGSARAIALEPPADVLAQRLDDFKAAGGNARPRPAPAEIANTFANLRFTTETTEEMVASVLSCWSFEHGKYVGDAQADIGVAQTEPVHVYIFGPPGSGKSTVVRMLQAKGCAAIDLEEIGAEPGPGNMFIGGGSVKPSSVSLKVMLLPSRSVYDARRAERDLRIPHKAGQGDYYDGFAASTDFDMIFHDESPEEIVHTLMAEWSCPDDVYYGEAQGNINTNVTNFDVAGTMDFSGKAIDTKQSQKTKVSAKLDLPNIGMTGINVTQTCLPDLAGAVGVTFARVLDVNPTRAVMPPSESQGVERPMDLQSLMTPTFERTIIWSTGQAEGSVLWSENLIPNPKYQFLSDGEDFTPTRAGYIAHNFQFWSGGIIKVLQIFAAPGHTGRIALLTHIRGLSIDTTDIADAQYMYVFDLSATQGRVALEFPFRAPTSMLRVPASNDITTFGPDAYSVGQISLRVLNPLRDTPLISSEVYINVYHGMSKDAFFDFAGPGDPRVTFNAVVV